MSLRIALFGQAPVALDCLERLVADGHQIVAVFAPPDASRPDPLAQRAKQLGLPVEQRRFFQKRDGTPIASALESYRQLRADLNVLASLTVFLPSEITDGPKHGSICFHPSLLPRYRGGNALQWQIMQGERETGVSIFVPDRGVDTGPIVVQRGGVHISPEDTTATLFFGKLAPLGAEALVEAVRAIDKGEAQLRIQDESLATFQGLVGDAEARLDWSRPAHEVDALIRGCDPQPGAWLRWNDGILRLFGAVRAEVASGMPGQIIAIDETGVRIALAGGASIRVAKIRAEGGKEAAQDFARRAGLKVGDVLESA